ncbi:MAG: hypothetical protein H6676_01435 [Thermoflexaceae bacterium]|nr:hypothetical protein [Thermoflexaceae bacterium]
MKQLLFELEVVRYLGTMFPTARWTGFLESHPDIHVSIPRFDVECTVHSKLTTDVGRLLDGKDKQHPDHPVPLVVAIGFRDGQTDWLNEIARDAPRHAPRMTRHPNLAAVLMFARLAGTFDYQVIEIRNDDAAWALAQPIAPMSAVTIWSAAAPGPVDRSGDFQFVRDNTSGPSR